MSAHKQRAWSEHRRMEFPKVEGRLEHHYPLKKLNTWKIGGLGELVFWPETINELVTMFQWCRAAEKPVVFLGRGSNVLLPDQGLKGLIIVNTRLDKKAWLEDSVICQAGVSLIGLSREAADRGLGGLEFACGIPGTLGAAIAINAGAYGGGIGKLVEKATVLTPEGELLTLSVEDISFGYRWSSLSEKKYLVLESTIRLNPVMDNTAMRENMKVYLDKRKATQPLEYPNAGSVFRNPPGDCAARLIEEAGWKGCRIGDAQVSEKHANFIVNRGNAKSEEILSLITEIREDIRTKFGVELVPEIKIIPA